MTSDRQVGQRKGGGGVSSKKYSLTRAVQGPTPARYRHGTCNTVYRNVSITVLRPIPSSMLQISQTQLFQQGTDTPLEQGTYTPSIKKTLPSMVQIYPFLHVQTAHPTRYEYKHTHILQLGTDTTPPAWCRNILSNTVQSTAQTQLSITVQTNPIQHSTNTALHHGHTLSSKVLTQPFITV
jgi:hypothetical protein